MSHNNRGRLTVDINGNWRLYTNTTPANSTPLGTVTRGIGDTGALVRINATGEYAQVNAGSIRSLDGRKVDAALGLTRSTTPEQIRAAREAAGLTQAQAASLVHAGSYRTWQDWERGARPMPLMAWELFYIKAARQTETGR